MAKRSETSWASGSFGPYWSPTTFGGGIMPVIVSGTFFGKTGSFVQFETRGTKRSEIEAGSAYWYKRGETMVTVVEMCYLPAFPVSGTTWNVMQQWKDLGPQTTSPPMSMEQVSGGLRFRGSHRGNTPFWTRLITNIAANTWYTLCTEVYLNGPAGSPGTVSPGWLRALLLINGVWTEVVPKSFPENGTWYTDGGQTSSRPQHGIYTGYTNLNAKRLIGYLATGTSLSDFGIVVGGTGGGGGGTGGGGDGDTPPNPVVPVDMGAEVGYALTKVGLTKASLSASAYPHYIDAASGRWVTTTAAGWTSGFLPAIYGRLFDMTGDTAWRDAMAASLAGLAGQATNASSAGADLGHRMKPFMRAYELTGTASYRDALLTAATTISGGWDAEVGAIRSWVSGVNGVTNFNTIIDSAAASEVMWWAARNGAADAATLRTRVTSHMQRLRAQHVRPDGSTYHLVEWNDATGAMITRRTIQGYADTSTWARGQAWAVYGFAVAAREAALAGQTTDAADFRATAVACANFFLNHLPADSISPWDFDAPAPATKDTSATAIAAAGLFVLDALDTTVDWGAQAENLVEALSANYHAPAAEYSVLDHGTSTHDGALVAAAAGQDTGLIYGDAYYLDALQAYRAAGLGTTKPLASLTTDATWSQFPNRSEGFSIVGGKGLLTLTDAIADAHADTNAEWVPEGDAEIAGAITFPAWISGSGVIELYKQDDWLDGNMIEVTRRLTFSAASGNANKVTGDTLELRMLRPNVNGGSSDPQPTIIPWSALPANTAHLKNGFLSDGLSVQTAVNGTSFGERVKRALPGTYDVTAPLRIRVGMRRPTPSDTIRVQTATIEKVIGSGTPTPNPGGTITKGDTALRFARDTIRVFPFISGTVAGFLSILKPIATDRTMAVGGVSKGAGLTPLSTFTQADGALPAPWAAVGSTTLATVAGNAFSSPTTGRAGAAYGTSMGSPDHAPIVRISSKPGTNPASTVGNWVGFFLRLPNTGSPSGGYHAGVDLTTTGTSRVFFSKVSTAGSPGAGLNGSTDYPAKTLANDDLLGARVVGTGATVTLEMWHKPSGGVWALWASYADSASPIVTGNLVGLTASGQGTIATKLDDFGAWASAGLDEAFPVSRAGRYQRVEAGGQPTYRDATLVPAGGLGGGTIPTGWSAVLTGRDTGDGHVVSYIWNAATLTWATVENAGVIGAGNVISDSGARYVIGDKEPGALTDQALNADVAAHVPLSSLPSLAQVQALVQPGGAITVDALKALPGALAVWAPALLAVATDPIVNQINPGTRDEIAGERVGTGALVTDTGNVPLGTGTGGGGGGPITPTASVPDGSGVQRVSSGIDPGDPTKATVTLSMDTTVADPAILYTPGANPYQPGYSDAGENGTVTWLAAQATNTWTVTGQPLSSAGAEPRERWWTGRYVNNAGATGNPQRPYVSVVVLDTAEPLTAVTRPARTREPLRFNGGTMEIRLARPATSESVDGYRVRVTPKTESGVPTGAQFLAFDGPGVVEGGEVVLTVTGLDDAVPRYGNSVVAWRTEV